MVLCGGCGECDRCVCTLESANGRTKGRFARVAVASLNPSRRPSITLRDHTNACGVGRPRKGVVCNPRAVNTWTRFMGGVCGKKIEFSATGTLTFRNHCIIEPKDILHCGSMCPASPFLHHECALHNTRVWPTPLYTRASSAGEWSRKGVAWETCSRTPQLESSFAGTLTPFIRIFRFSD
jgi:hypothetical protein